MRSFSHISRLNIAHWHNSHVCVFNVLCTDVDVLPIPGNYYSIHFNWLKRFRIFNNVLDCYSITHTAIPNAHSFFLVSVWICCVLTDWQPTDNKPFNWLQLFTLSQSNSKQTNKQKTHTFSFESFLGWFFTFDTQQKWKKKT